MHAIIPPRASEVHLLSYSIPRLFSLSENNDEKDKLPELSQEYGIGEEREGAETEEEQDGRTDDKMKKEKGIQSDKEIEIDKGSDKESVEESKGRKKKRSLLKEKDLTHLLRGSHNIGEGDVRVRERMQENMQEKIDGRREGLAASADVSDIRGDGGSLSNSVASQSQSESERADRAVERVIELSFSSSSVGDAPSPAPIQNLPQTPSETLSPRPTPSLSFTFPAHFLDSPVKNQHPSSNAQASNAIPSRAEINEALSHPPPMRVSYTSSPISSLPSSTPSTSSPSYSMAPSGNNSLEGVKVNTTDWLKEKNEEATQFNATDFADSDVTDYFKQLTVCMQGESISLTTSIPSFPISPYPFPLRPFLPFLPFYLPPPRPHPLYSTASQRINLNILQRL
jgi:hypothetical protein